MLRLLVGLCCAAGLFLGPLAMVEAQGKKKVQITKQWSGSVDDENLAKAAPAVITSAKGLEKTWREWKIDGKVPDVDFMKEIVLVTTSRGSKLSLTAVLGDQGNLQVLGLGTRDLRPGFRYVLASVSREGVKTVNGKEVPKE